MTFSYKPTPDSSESEYQRENAAGERPDSGDGNHAVEQQRVNPASRRQFSPSPLLPGMQEAPAVQPGAQILPAIRPGSSGQASLPGISGKPVKNPPSQSGLLSGGYAPNVDLAPTRNLPNVPGSALAANGNTDRGRPEQAPMRSMPGVPPSPPANFGTNGSPSPLKNGTGLAHVENRPPTAVPPVPFTPPPTFNAAPPVPQTNGAYGGWAAPPHTPPASPIPNTPPLMPRATGLRQQSPAAPPRPPLEIVNGNVILYRRPNFFVRTAYRPGQRSTPLHRPSGRTTKVPRVLPQQEARVAVSETRLMPSVSLEQARQTRAIPLPAWLEAIMVVIGLAGVLVSHMINMFNFPRYELDEGTYISNAWAMTQGMLSAYPYGYGHPILGWMQIAGWLQLTGGVFTFGNALNSGRVFMLFYAVGCALLLYLIVRRMGGSRAAALLALVLFAFSPLSITYQRQIFLDNIATFWLLLSLYLVVISESRMLYLVGAACALGISILSKEVFILALPPMIYAAWLHITKFQRKFALVAFIYIVGAVCSTWVLMAILKGELFPYTWHLPWDTHPHLSMFDTFLGQAARSQTNGSFIDSWDTWFGADSVFMLCSLAAPAFNLVYGWWNRKHLMLALLALFFWLLLARGGQVLSFYIIPLLPLVALNTALALNTVLGWLGKVVRFDIVRVVLLAIMFIAVLPYDIQQTDFRYYQHPTSTQQQAMVWIRNHVPHDAFVVINSYLYLDLRVPGGVGVGEGAPYPHAEVYWNIEGDPNLYETTLQNNWDRIDYIVADSEMLTDIKTFGGHMDLIKQALDHAVLRADFRTNDHNLQIVVQIYQVIHKSPPPVVYQAPHTASGFNSSNSPLTTSGALPGSHTGSPLADIPAGTNTALAEASRRNSAHSTSPLSSLIQPSTA